jgi:hypothetical protein
MEGVCVDALDGSTRDAEQLHVGVATWVDRVRVEVEMEALCRHGMVEVPNVCADSLLVVSGVCGPALDEVRPVEKCVGVVSKTDTEGFGG